jgi:transposase
MPPAYVKPYVKRQKNDAADAEAICEAVTRTNMRFVPIKTPEQQSGLMLHAPSVHPAADLGDQCDLVLGTSRAEVLVQIGANNRHLGFQRRKSSAITATRLNTISPCSGSAVAAADCGGPVRADSALAARRPAAR